MKKHRNFPLTVPLTPENKRAAEETCAIFNHYRIIPFWKFHSNMLRVISECGLN